MATDTGNIFYVRNAVQKALFDKELKGQLSDGWWENASPHDHYRDWCNAEVVVAKPDEPLGHVFSTMRQNYALDAKGLLDCVGDRMLAICREASGDPNYTLAQMRKELRDLKAHMRNWLQSEFYLNLERQAKARRSAQRPSEMPAFTAPEHLTRYTFTSERSPSTANLNGQ